MQVVVDATIVVDWISPDSSSTLPAHDVFIKLAVDEANLTAPSLLFQEIANALLVGVREHRWSSASADSAYLDLKRMPLVIRDDQRDVDRAWDLARRYDNYPMNGMLYLALAERLGATFMTADDELRTRLAHLPWVVGLAGVDVPSRPAAWLSKQTDSD
jgi:predicted nucleic acid-binding protein